MRADGLIQKMWDEDVEGIADQNKRLTAEEVLAARKEAQSRRYVAGVWSGNSMKGRGSPLCSNRKTAEDRLISWETPSGNAIYISLSHFVLLNKHHKLWPRERKHPVWPKLWTERHSVSVDLRFERRITVYKHLEGLPDTCLSFTNLLLHLLSLTTWTHPNAIDTSKSLIGNDFSIKWTLESR